MSDDHTEGLVAARYTLNRDEEKHYAAGTRQKIFTGTIEVFAPQEAGGSKLGTLIFTPEKLTLRMEGSKREIPIEYPHFPGERPTGINLVFMDNEYFSGYHAANFAAAVASGKKEDEIARDISITTMSMVKFRQAAAVDPSGANKGRH